MEYHGTNTIPYDVINGYYSLLLVLCAHKRSQWHALFAKEHTIMILRRPGEHYKHKLYGNECSSNGNWIIIACTRTVRMRQNICVPFAPVVAGVISGHKPYRMYCVHTRSLTLQCALKTRTFCDTSWVVESPGLVTNLNRRTCSNWSCLNTYWKLSFLRGGSSEKPEKAIRQSWWSTVDSRYGDDWKNDFVNNLC